MQDIMRKYGEVQGMVNTDLIETAELEDLIGQTSQCMHSGKEHHESHGDHAHELAEARRCAVDEAHDLTIECQAFGGCKGCVGVPRGSLAERSQTDNQIEQSWWPVVGCCGALTFPHLSMTAQDHLTTAPTPHSTIHKELALWQHSSSWMEGHTGGSRSIPTVHPCSQSGRRLWVARKALHLHEPNHEGNGRSIHNSFLDFVFFYILAFYIFSFFMFALSFAFSSSPFPVPLLPFLLLLLLSRFFSFFFSFFPKLIRTRHFMSAQRGVHETRDGSVRQ